VKLDPECVLRSASGQLPSPGAAPGWRVALPLIAAAVVAILAIYRDTARSIVAIWGSSDTYAHGYLIVPIALALIWMKRGEAATIVPRPDVRGFVLLAGCGFAWLAAEAAQVQVLQQYALAGMMAAAVLALAGRRVAWAIAFPLAFLLLAVPYGEAFLPRLMDWTADFTVTTLRLTGIPVYREGNFFAIPSGQWSVVEACSGLRYLIASITVGALYAYLTYRLWWKRALFLALSIAVPIFANFLRAYMIVMIGHLSSMKLAVGVDHFIYGWVFFGLVIGLLFWVGSFWRDAPSPSQHSYRAAQAGPASPAVLAGAALGVAALASAWPLYAEYLDRGEPRPTTLAAPAGASGWALDSTPSLQWRPHYEGATASMLGVYRNGEDRVAVYLAYYRNQRQGAELVGSQNVVAGNKDSPWSVVGAASRVESLGGRELDVRQSRLRSAAGRLIVWDWYRIGERHLANPYVAKALLARDKLLGRGDDSAAIALATPYDTRPEPAAETLRLFVRDMLPAIDKALLAAGQGSVR
jgi:exosortase A